MGQTGSRRVGHLRFLQAAMSDGKPRTSRRLAGDHAQGSRAATINVPGRGVRVVPQVR